MNFIKKTLFIAAFACAASTTANAADEYPELYVRGTMTDNWSCQEQYRMTRNGNTYTITLSQLDGKFKLGSADWVYNLGSEVAAEIDDAATLSVIQDGANITAKNLTNTTITVTTTIVNGRFGDTLMSIDANGHQAPEIDDNDNDNDSIIATPYYVCGNFNNWQLGANLLKVTPKDNGDVSFTITGAAAGDCFKVTDNPAPDWATFDNGVIGIASTSYTVQPATLYAFVSGRVGNIALPAAGDWVVTIYPTDNQIVITQPGQTVPAPVTNPVDPEPGNTDNTDTVTGTLPVLYINVKNDDGTLNNEIIDYDLAHKNYFTNAEYWLDVTPCQWAVDELGATSIGTADEPLPLAIKARGNYTRTAFAKKPFKLKLGKKQSLLGMSKSKHYALLAGADDNYGYMRNYAGFNLGDRIGLPWTPTQQPVEVVINGDYRGLYFLTESIRVGDDRITINELNDSETDPALVSGGYLIELDNYDEENQLRLTEKSCVDGQLLDVLRVTFDTPEVYSDIQRQFINDQFDRMNTLTGNNDNDLWSYIDLDDAARYYIVEEIVSHTESYHGSTYMYRDRGENQKWHFSPLWDFGNAFNGSTSDYLYNGDPFGNTWIPSFRCNDKFNNCVSETWKWFMTNKFDGLYDEMLTLADRIAAAAAADHKRWNDIRPNGGSKVADNTDIKGRTQAAIDHIKQKVEWLKQQPQAYGNFTDTTYPEPARDTTPAAELPSYISAVDNIAADNTDNTVHYYNLQGIEIDNPAPGSIVIRRQGNHAAKTLVK